MSIVSRFSGFCCAFAQMWCCFWKENIIQVSWMFLYGIYFSNNGNAISQSNEFFFGKLLEFLTLGYAARFVLLPLFFNYDESHARACVASVAV